MKNNIHIDIEENFQKIINKGSLKICASEALSLGSNSLCNDSLSVSITNSEIIKNLNKKYLDNNYVTDVLAFPNDLSWNEGIKESILKDNFNNNSYLGDIFISYEKIIEQSEIFSLSPKLELNIILSHGILHLLGYDHYDDNSKNKMDNLTVKIIKNLKLDHKKAKISLESRNE